MNYRAFFKKEIYYDFVCIKNIIKYLLFPDKYILLKTSIKYTGGQVVKFNWGDDVSFVLVKSLSKKIPLFYPNTRISRHIPIETFMTVGSIITYFPLNDTVVWGSGIINPNEVDRIIGTPNQICAVRGPCTREQLLKLGFSCPEVYGDPALLFPKIYQPDAVKKWTLGVIPHYTDMDSKAIEELRQNKQVKIINVQGYHDWKEFIDEICSCEYTISSSLHGLIISEAYNVPSVWVKFGKYIDGWDFKFKDFYASINKGDTTALEIEDSVDMQMIREKALEWKQGSFDADRLMNACPFIKGSLGDRDE